MIAEKELLFHSCFYPLSAFPSRRRMASLGQISYQELCGFIKKEDCSCWPKRAHWFCLIQVGVRSGIRFLAMTAKSDFQRPLEIRFFSGKNRPCGAYLFSPRADLLKSTMAPFSGDLVSSPFLSFGFIARVDSVSVDPFRVPPSNQTRAYSNRLNHQSDSARSIIPSISV
jgi:hypothetical protein